MLPGDAVLHQADAVSRDKRAYRLAALLVILAVGYAVLLWSTLADPAWWLAVATIPLWIGAVITLAYSRIGAGRSAWLVLGFGAVLQVLAVLHAPNSSDDYARYIWDARVQLFGVDPYRYPPSAHALAHLRFAPLFQAPPCGALHAFPGGCTQVNRPGVRTIYPPVAQAAFALLRLVSFGGRGGHGGALILQVAGALAVLAVTALMLRRAISRATPIWHAAIWAWSPITSAELVTNAHIEWLAVLLVVLAFEVVLRRPALAGALVGAAISTKLYPALVLPALLRRRPWRVLAAAAAVVVLGYLPHVAAVGSDVIGYLPGYLNEEGYSAGWRLKLLGVFGRPGAEIAGVLVLGAVCWWALRRSESAAPERTAVVVVGAALLVVTPDYAWYGALLLALVAMSGSIQWLPVAIAPTISYLHFRAFGQAFPDSHATYLMAALAVLALWLLGRRRISSAHPKPAEHVAPQPLSAR